MPTADLQSKISRAVRAVLLDQGAAAADNCFADPDDGQRGLPNSTIIPGDSTAFDGPGNFHFPAVRINLRDDANTQPDVADAVTPRVLANQRFAKIYNALCRSDDQHTMDYMARELTRVGNLLATDQSYGKDPIQTLAAADNADMADFTVLYWWLEDIGGVAKHVEGETYWEREMVFSCVACSLNFNQITGGGGQGATPTFDSTQVTFDETGVTMDSQ